MRKLATFLTVKCGANKDIRKLGKAVVGGAAAVLLAFVLAGDVVMRTSESVAPEQPGKATLVEAYGKLPLSFEANRGQTDGRVKFLSRGNGYTLFLTPAEAVLTLSKSGSRATEGSPEATRRVKPDGLNSAVLRMQLAGANPDPEIVGLGKLPGKSNYFVGNDPSKWRTSIPNYTRVKYEDVYPGVDLVFYGNQRQLEYDLVVAPGADTRAIRLDFQGMEKLEIDAQGNLILHMANGDEITQHKPYIYQEINGGKQAVPGQYVLNGKRQVGFQVAAYDTSKPLVIDPVLSYSTYLGGSDLDSGSDIAVDADGNAYVTGLTFSFEFPTLNPFQPSKSINRDAFVAKLDPAGTLVYSTYLGGTGEELGAGIAVDDTGSAYVTGTTVSTDFPTTLGAFDTDCGTDGDCDPDPIRHNDIFVVKLDPTGSALVYSTYLGGSGTDRGSDIAVDSAGSAYMTASTFSADFPTLNPFQPVFGGPSVSIFGGDAVVVKINAAGSALVYSTYLGGTDSEQGADIAVDAAGNAYVTGFTFSTDFPTLNAFQPAIGADFFDAFVTKLDPTGSALVYSTYLGGNDADNVGGIAVDASGNAYVGGLTRSTDFPTLNAFQPAFGGGLDAFVTKLDPTGSALVYSTYLGGSGSDRGSDIAVDSAGSAYLTGDTFFGDFPTERPTQADFGGLGDAFVTKLDPTGFALVYSTYLGGGSRDGGSAIAVDAAGSAYVTGRTNSADFPTANAVQAAFGGVTDAFVVKLFPAQERIELIIDDVLDLVDVGTLNRGQGGSLIKKLDAAIDLLDKGQTNGAIHKLQDFVSQVNAYINTGKLSPEEGQPLIDSANDVIDGLSG